MTVCNSRLSINPYYAGYFKFYAPSLLFYQTSLQDSRYWRAFTSRAENSVDSDQLASEKPADLDLHCFENIILLSMLRAMIFHITFLINEYKNNFSIN